MTTPSTYLTNGQSLAPRLTSAQAGEQLDNAVREAINRMLADVKRCPSVAYDMRRRPIGFRSLGVCLAQAARAHVPVDRALAIAEAVHSFVLLLFAHERTPLLEAWQRETREQGEADVSQGAALCTRSLGDLDRAIEETQQEIGAKRHLLVALQRQRAAVTDRRFAPLAAPRT